MKLFVRLQELMHKDQDGILTCEEVQAYTREARVVASAIPVEYSRMRKSELMERRASDPLVTRHAFYQYLMNELNAPYMRAQERE